MHTLTTLNIIIRLKYFCHRPTQWNMFYSRDACGIHAVNCLNATYSLKSVIFPNRLNWAFVHRAVVVQDMDPWGDAGAADARPGQYIGMWGMHWVERERESEKEREEESEREREREIRPGQWWPQHRSAAADLRPRPSGWVREEHCRPPSPALHEEDKDNCLLASPFLQERMSSIVLMFVLRPEVAFLQVSKCSMLFYFIQYEVWI